MSILSDLISSIKTSDLVEQMRILTEQIFEEESKEMKYIEHRPTGANIFLSLQVPGLIKTDVGFLALERENEDLWIASFWSIPEKNIKKAIKDEEPVSLRKKKTYQIKDHRPDKILTQYAKLFKFHNGE